MGDVGWLSEVVVVLWYCGVSLCHRDDNGTLDVNTSFLHVG